METKQTIELTIVGMSCGHCVRAVREALAGVSGVNQAEVELEPGHAKVMADAEVDVEKLIEAVREEGYDARRA